MFKKNDIVPINTVSVNELLKQTEQNWNRLTAKTYSNKTYAFIVMDLNGTVVFSTTKEQSTSYLERINSAIANRNILVDIIVNETIVGKLIIKNDLSAAMTEERKQLEWFVLFFFLFMGVLMLGYFFYLERKVFMPFHKLKQFASSIASGNMDAPITMDNENVFGAFTESFDLMRDALQTAKRNEYLANKSKKELVASLSHDIKNPVASIKAICETMALKSDDKHIITIHQKAEQIDRLISDMFHSTLEELGELKVKNEEFTSDILLEVIENSNYYHNINIVSKPPECIILCDKLRLTQIFDNLVGNSYKYAGTDINISFQLDSTHLQIRIKDFGKGIQEEELPLVWEKFYRGKNSEGKDGAGLGLYISRLFIEKMGGQIECLNQQDGFLVKLELKLAGENI
ncbi:MAG TPA: HAMP domain-containing sensor histidine kinase [Ruminiclostridium sp.]